MTAVLEEKMKVTEHRISDLEAETQELERLHTRA